MRDEHDAEDECGEAVENHPAPCRILAAQLETEHQSVNSFYDKNRTEHEGQQQHAFQHIGHQQQTDRDAQRRREKVIKPVLPCFAEDRGEEKHNAAGQSDDTDHLRDRQRGQPGTPHGVEPDENRKNAAKDIPNATVLMRGVIHTTSLVAAEPHHKV